MKKIVIILGPTAVGKSDIGIELAKEFNGEIVSADSVQIYKGLDIGSAKISHAEMENVPHHCIDILPPQSDFSVYDFVNLTRQKIDEIINRGRLPFLVGGTGLYIRALLGGYDFGGTGRQVEFRQQLEKVAEKDLSELYNELKKKDPQRAEKIKPNDKKRIIRGLEIAEFGETPKNSENQYDALIFSLTMDREKLYERINERAEKMFEKGLVEEVKNLLNMGVTQNSQSMKAIGYKEVIAYLNGEYNQEKMIELVKQHSRNYAKRQMTFFRSLKEAKMISVEDREKAIREGERYIEEWLK